MNNYEKILLIRPIIDGMEIDCNQMPIIDATKFEVENFKKIRITNFKNLNSIKNRENTILDMFNYDYVLDSVWRKPLKYVAKFYGLMAIASPDFSIYPNMNKHVIQYNVYKNRWIGALWSLAGYFVIPTVSWAGPETYDICFSGIKKGSVVIISTLGVGENTEMFLNGFNELKKRVGPQLFILVGKRIDGMTGKFLQFDLIDTFNPKRKSEQISFFPANELIINEKGGIEYGW